MKDEEAYTVWVRKQYGSPFDHHMVEFPTAKEAEALAFEFVLTGGYIEAQVRTMKPVVIAIVRKSGARDDEDYVKLVRCKEVL